MPAHPPRFDRLRLKNVRCFRDAEIPFDKHVTLIVGENASGKTTLMEALASLTHGEDEGLASFPLRHGARQGEVTLYENGRRTAAARWRSNLPSRTRLPADRYAFLYGRYRRVLLPDSLAELRNLTDAQYLDELASHAAQSRTLTLTQPDNRLLRDLPGYLRGLYSGRAADPRLDTIWSRLNTALTRLDPSLAGIRMERGVDAYIPRIIRNGLALDLAELSDGYQAVLVIVLDLMLRYAYLDVGTDQPHALVGIDEIDLHLHPRWQRTVLKELKFLFPHTQFILTTHSPIVVQSAIDQNFLVLRLIERDGQVTAKPVSPRLMKRLRGAEVGSVLFEEHLFGIESRFSVEYEQIEQRVEELQALVSRGRATASDYQELRSKLDTLEELVAKEDRRRADGSTMAQMVKMQAEFVKALTDELENARK